MDKRVVKTLTSLRGALLTLLNEKEFDKITVKEICDRAQVSRITFYTYFHDKYDLMNDMFRLLGTKVSELYQALDAKNNPEGSAAISFHNLLCAILDASHDDLLSYPKLLNNSDLILAYYRFATGVVEKFETEHSDRIHTRYDLKRLNAFLIMGFWAYARLGGDPFDAERIKAETKDLIADLADSKIFD